MKFADAFKKGILLFDGSMGVLLQQRGIKPPHCPEEANLLYPEAVTQIHRDYIAAGAQIVETNSIGGNGIQMRRHGMADKLVEANRAALENARAAAGPEAMVAFSSGPSGDFLKPLGGLNFAEMYESFACQFALAHEYGADVIFIETQCDLTEARVAMLAAKENSPLPFVPSFTFSPNGFTVMGNPPEACAAIAKAMGAAAVGINCSGGPNELLPVVKAFRSCASLPLIVQPNAGMPILVKGETVFPYGAEEMAQLMLPILEAGADAIGGCCGTTPEHIAQMSALIQGRPLPVRPQNLPPVVASPRVCLPLEKALAQACEATIKPGQDSMDVLDQLLDGALAVLLHVGEMEPAALPALVQDIQGLVKQPLLFQTRTWEQAEAVLRHYHGVAAIQCPAAICDLAGFYGAVAL